MKNLFNIICLAVILCSSSAAQDKAINFALLSDTHFNSFQYAEDDLRKAVDDINSSDSLDFVIVSGDLVEFGETGEYSRYKSIVSNLRIPLHVVTGNHDTNWSENGCTSFAKFFGNTHFVFDFRGYRFIGLGAGPMLKMGAPYYPRQEVKWLKSVIDTTHSEVPIIFINHFPMDRPICNGHEVLQILKKKNLKLILSGHEHKNSFRSFEGVPGIVCRSILRREEPIGAFNVVSIHDSIADFSERIIATSTNPKWASVNLSKYHAALDTYPKGDTVSYALNSLYPDVIEQWKVEEDADISSQAQLFGNTLFYTTSAGDVVARDAVSGSQQWRYSTSHIILCAPFVDKKAVYITCTDGNIYCLKRSDGTLIWSKSTGYPMVASPLVQNGILFTGSSCGKFYALNASTGVDIWCTTGLTGFIEARPCADKANVYVGTWGGKFYALNINSGKISWEFDTGMGRYFSPGACWPFIAHNKVYVQSSDYFIRAFEPLTGYITWKDNEPKGREAIGLSDDSKTVFIQGINNWITAIDITRQDYPQKWRFEMPYEANFVPTALLHSNGNVHVASAFGVVYAVKDDGTKISWQHKVSNAAVTSLSAVNAHALIVCTMDGKIVRLKTKH